MLDCPYVQAKLPLYLQRELPLTEQRHVAQHLAHCASCQAEYERQKALTNDLKRVLPVLGQSASWGRGEIYPSQTKQQMLWQNIQAQLQAPVPRARLPLGRMVAVVFGALLLPLWFSRSPVSVTVPEPPKPITLTVSATPTAYITDLATRVALIGLTATTQQELGIALLQNTPPPVLAGR